MTDQDYEAWLSVHAATFAIPASPQTAASFQSWRPVFEAERVTVAELKNATMSLARSLTPPQWLREHLPALNRSIKEQRTIVSLQRAHEQEDRGTCTLCNGSALVTVPHPRCLDQRGEFAPNAIARGSVGTYYELSVYCRCGLGRWLEDRQAEYWARKNRESGRDPFANDRRGPWSLDRYEQLNPHWRDQMWEREQADQAAAKAQRGPMADSLDGCINRLRKRAQEARQAPNRKGLNQ